VLDCILLHYLLITETQRGWLALGLSSTFFSVGSEGIFPEGKVATSLKLCTHLHLTPTLLTSATNRTLFYSGYTTCCEIWGVGTYVTLKDRKRSLSGKTDHNALWHYRNSHNAKLRVVAVSKQPQCVVAWEKLPQREIACCGSF